ncbi:MAG TPA: hypothetical protein VHB54_04830 [Mucilaginibacter sp.]|nr:hypothetical protein [Mucilaginibacter sp.]
MKGILPAMPIMTYVKFIFIKEGHSLDVEYRHRLWTLMEQVAVSFFGSGQSHC